jgi:hypothetical protein
MLDQMGLVESTMATIIALGIIIGRVWRSLTARIDNDLEGMGRDLTSEASERGREDTSIWHDLKNLATKQER